MTNFLNRAEMLGLGNLLNSNSTSPTASTNTYSGIITIDQLINAPSAQGSIYIQNNLVRAKNLGTPYPAEPTITLKQFVDELVGALAELFRARGYERIADYLLSQHDLDSVFGQLATRMLQMHQETQARESLIAKYLRINAGSSSLLTENQVDLTYADSSSSVTSMSSGQLGELNNILTGYSDGTGSHEGINAVSQSITGATLQPAEDSLAQLSTTAEFLDPDNSQIQAGLTAANSIAKTMQNRVSSSNTNLALIQNGQTNTQGYSDSGALLSTAQTGSYSAATYQQSSLTNTLADLTNNVVNPNTSGAQPLYPPLYVAGTNYSPSTFATFGYEVYQCIGNTSGSPASDPNNWLDTGCQPIGGAYQMKSLTTAANNDVNYLSTYGQVDYSQGSNYVAAQNITDGGQSYYATKDLTIQNLQTGTFNTNDAVKSQSGQIYRDISGSIKIVNLTPGTKYNAGDLVQFNGNLFKATKSGIYEPNVAQFNGTTDYNNGDYTLYNQTLYQANQDSPTSSFSFGNGSSANLQPGGTDYNVNSTLSSYNIGNGEYANVTYTDGSTGQLTGRSSSSAPTLGPGSATSASQDGNGVINVQLTNTSQGGDHFQILDIPNGQGDAYAGGFDASFDLDLGGRGANGFSFSFVNGNDPAKVHDSKGGGYANGAGTTGMSVLFDDANNSNVDDDAFGVNVVSFANAGTGKFDFSTTVGYNSGYNQGDFMGRNKVTISVRGKQITVDFLGKTLANLTLRDSYTPDGSWKFVLGASNGGTKANQSVNNLVITPAGASVRSITQVGNFNPDINSNFTNIGGYQNTLDPTDSNSNFTAYDPGNDSANWQVYSPSTDTSRWNAGISPAVLAAQKDLQNALKLVQSLFDTTSMVAGTRQDFLSITGSMPQDGSTPVINAFSVQRAEAFELARKQDYLTAMSALLNQPSPNFSQVKSNAATLQSQIQSQILSSSQQDPNQQWGAILQSLSTLITQCNNGDKAGALATLGTAVVAPSPTSDGTDSTSANAAMSGNPPATLQVQFLMQYSTLSPADIGDNVAQSIQVNGQTDLDNSPYLGTLQKLQAFQQLVQRVNSGDTSEPAAQLFNEMQNTLQDLYDSQSLTGTPIFSQADYAAAQTHLAHAMLTRGNGGINITLSLAQVEALPNSDARKGTLLGLYRDMYKAIGDINNFNAVNNYIAGQNPPPAGQGTGYLAQVAGDMSSLSSSASGINTPETGHQQRRRLLQFWGIPIGIQRSRKFTSGDSFTSLKNTYDNIKSQVTSMMSNMNTDLLFAANQYVGDAYVAPPAGQSTPASQRVVYNGQFYKSLTTTNDRPDVGASRQPPTWELMTFNVNRGRTYQFGDVVTYNGQMFRCIDSNMPSSSDPTTIPGSTFSRNNWAQISYQTGYHYLAGDTVLIQQNGQYIPYVAKVEYTAGDSSDLNNTALWNVGYNNAVTVNSSGQIQAAATLGGMSANVNGGNTQFNGNLTANQLSGLAFSTLNNSRNGAVGAAFNGWVSNNSQFLNSGTAGGTATNYDGMQFFNPAMQTATSLMQTMQMIDLFFYAHQQFTISGGGNYYTGYTSPIISLTWGASDEGGSNAYNSVTNPQIFDASAARQVFSVSSDHNMGNTTSPSWRDAEDKITTSLYQASRALAGQLKSQVSSFQNNFNTMKLQVQQEAYRLLAKAFVNTTDIQASLTQLFRNAPLTDDEKKLLAKILAVVMSLLIAILGANPQIRGAFTQQTVVTGKSPTGQPQTSSQWVFNDALSSVRISKTFANNLIAKAIALADQLLSEKKRSSSVSDDRLSTNDYLNMQAFAEGQKEALENLDAQNSQARQRV